MKKTRSDRRRVAPTEAKKWLAEREAGASVMAIADRENLDPRTIRFHVARARQVQATGSARADLLRAALEAHQRDLAALTAALARRLAAPGPPTAAQSRSGLPPTALADHLGRSPTGRALQRWLALAAGYPALRQALQDRLAADPRVAAFDAGGGSLPGLQAAAVALAEGTDLDALPVSVHGSVLWRGAFGVGEVAVEAADTRKLRDALVAEHRQLLDMAAGWPEAAALGASLAEARRLGGPLRDTLDVLRLRRYISGSCRYCPNAEGV